MRVQQPFASAFVCLTFLVMLASCNDWSKDTLLELPPASFGEPKQDTCGNWTIGLTWQIKGVGQNPRWYDTVLVWLNKMPLDTLVLQDSSRRQNAYNLPHSVNARVEFDPKILAFGINQFTAEIHSVERGGNLPWRHPALFVDKRCAYGFGQLIGMNWLIPVVGVFAGAFLLAWLMLEPPMRWSIRRVVRKSSPWLPLDQCTVQVTAGTRCGEIICLPELLNGQPMTLGSAVADAVRFSSDPFMAGQHAALLLDPQKRRICIRSTGPERPVYVNGRLLAPDQLVWLKTGDMLSLGSVTLVFRERRAVRFSV